MKNVLTRVGVFLLATAALTAAFAAIDPAHFSIVNAACSGLLGHFAGVAGVALALGPAGVPTMEDINRYRVTNPAASEVIRQRLYDYQLYATAGVAQMTFFSTPVGQGKTTATGGTAGTPKTLWDTNMQLGGQLPSGMMYLCESLEIYFQPGSVSTADTYTPENMSKFVVAAAATVAGGLNDINTILQSGMVEFNVLQKNYVRETPIMAFPQKAYLDGFVALATNSATVGEVFSGTARSTGRPYYLEPQVLLQPGMNFEVLIRWPAAVATPSGFNGRVGAIFDGYMVRAGQ